MRWCGVCLSCSSSSLSRQGQCKLGQNYGPLDGSGFCLGALYTMTNMAIVVPIATKTLKLAHCSESASALAWSLEPDPLGMLQEKSVVTASLMAGRGRWPSRDLTFMSLSRQSSLMKGSTPCLLLHLHEPKGLEKTIAETSTASHTWASESTKPPTAHLSSGSGFGC